MLTMKAYMVYFEIYGKKMKTSVMARNRKEAEALVRERLTIHKIDEVKKDGLDVFDYFTKNIFE